MINEAKAARTEADLDASQGSQGTKDNMILIKADGSVQDPRENEGSKSPITNLKSRTKAGGHTRIEDVYCQIDTFYRKDDWVGLTSYFDKQLDSVEQNLPALYADNMKVMLMDLVIMAYRDSAVLGNQKAELFLVGLNDLALVFWTHSGQMVELIELLLKYSGNNETLCNEILDVFYEHMDINFAAALIQRIVSEQEEDGFTALAAATKVIRPSPTFTRLFSMPEFGAALSRNEVRLAVDQYYFRHISILCFNKFLQKNDSQWTSSLVGDEPVTSALYQWAALAVGATTNKYILPEEFSSRLKLRSSHNPDSLSSLEGPYFRLAYKISHSLAFGAHHDFMELASPALLEKVDDILINQLLSAYKKLVMLEEDHVPPDRQMNAAILVGWHHGRYVSEIADGALFYLGGDDPDTKEPLGVSADRETLIIFLKMIEDVIDKATVELNDVNILETWNMSYNIPIHVYAFRFLFTGQYILNRPTAINAMSSIFDKIYGAPTLQLFDNDFTLPDKDDVHFGEIDGHAFDPAFMPESQGEAPEEDDEFSELMSVFSLQDCQRPQKNDIANNTSDAMADFRIAQSMMSTLTEMLPHHMACRIQFNPGETEKMQYSRSLGEDLQYRSRMCHFPITALDKKEAGAQAFDCASQKPEANHKSEEGAAKMPQAQTMPLMQYIGYTASSTPRAPEDAPKRPTEESTGTAKDQETSSHAEKRRKLGDSAGPRGPLSLKKP